MRAQADNVHVLGAEDDHWALLAAVLAELTHPSGNLFFDVRTVVLMREHGVRRIYTTDTDFLQFPAIEVVNPLRHRERRPETSPPFPGGGGLVTYRTASGVHESPRVRAASGGFE